MAQKELFSDFNTLPPEAQKQVIDFIAFLQTRYSSVSKSKLKPKAKIVDETFVGIWRNRKDMQDSSAWVRKIRASEWG